MIKHLKPHSKIHIFWHRFKDKLKRKKKYVIDIECFPFYDYPVRPAHYTAVMELSDKESDVKNLTNS